MKTIDEIHWENLMALISEAGSVKVLAEKYGCTDNYINQLKARSVSSGKPKAMGKGSPRKFEICMNKPSGWMDTDHSKEVSNQTSMEAAPSALNPKQQALLGYFNGLTESQQEEVMRELQEKKQQNDNLLLELLERKANHK